MSTTTDQRSLLPTSVTVLFPRQDSGVPAASPTAYTVTLASLGLAESASPLATFVGSHVIWSSCVAYWTGGGSADNNTELQALANQMATDWYRWQLAPYDLALQGMVPWSPDGGHDLIFQHNGQNHCETRVVRGPWLDHLDQLLAKGTYGSSTPGDDVIGGTLNIVNSTLNVNNTTTTFTGGSTTFNGPTLYPPYGSAVTINSNTDNLTLAAGPVQFWNVTSAVNLTGIVAGASGYRVVFVNTGNATLTLKNEDASSTAANRFRTPYATKADVLLPPNFACELQYDTTISRWRILWVSSVHLIGTDAAVGSLSSTETDYAIDQRYPFQVWTPANGGTRLNSIANGKLGQFYFIQVADGDPDDVLTIGHQDAGGAAGNLINCPGEVDYVVPSCGGAILFYDGTFWNVVAAIPTRPKITTITDANVVLPVPVAQQEFAILGVPLTAVRTVTLPSASDSPAGTVVTVVDKAGSVGSTNYLNAIRAGSDTINGGTSYAIQTPYSKIDFVSDGSSKWTVNPGFSTPVAIAQGGTGATTALGAWDNLAAQTRDTETLTAATTLDLGAVTSWGVDAGGTSDPGGITSLGTASAGVVRAVRFTSAGILLKHNVTSLVLPGGADVTTAAGDVAIFQSLGSGNWVCVSYLSYTTPGTYLTASAIGSTVQGYDATLAALAAYNTNGIVCQTAANTFAGRTLTAGSGVAVTNGDGVSGNPTVTVDITGLTATDLATDDEVPLYDTSATANRKVTLERLGGFIDPAICRGRLTLTSGTAVTTSDVTSAGTIYFTPFEGNRVALYDGTRWKLYTFTERSLSLTLTSGKNYDVFLYDNSGTLTLELSSAWTDDTTRADALTTQDGIYVKSGATTRRHLGFLRASGSNTTESSLAKRFVVNRYNPVALPIRANPGYSNGNTTTTYSTTSTTYTEANGGTNSKAEFLTFGHHAPRAVCTGVVATLGAGNTARVGIGVDSTSSAYSSGLCSEYAHTMTCAHENFMSEGYHYYDLLICSPTGASISFLADYTRLGSSSDPRGTAISGAVWG